MYYVVPARNLVRTVLQMVGQSTVFPAAGARLRYNSTPLSGTTKICTTNLNTIFVLIFKQKKSFQGIKHKSQMKSKFGILTVDKDI